MRIATAIFCCCAGLLAQAPKPQSAPAALQALQVEALRRNPDLTAAAAGVRAAQDAVAPAGTLPDPQFMVQQMSVGGPLPFAGYRSSGFAFTGFGISQQIPYPGKLGLSRAVAGSHAAAAAAALRSDQRALAAEVAAAYFDLADVRESLELLANQRALLKQIEQAAELRYRTAAGTQVDVLTAQFQQTDLERERQTDTQQAAGDQERLRWLLGRPPGSAAIAPLPLAPSRLRRSDQQLRAALPASPALAVARAEVAGASQSLALARKNLLPDFNVQYMYENTGPAYPNYYQWTVGISLPLFHRGSRQRPEQQRAAAQAVRQQAHYTATLHQQRYQLDSLLITAHSQEQILALTHDGLLPQARAAVQSAMAAFRAGTLDLRPALDAARQLLQVQQQYWHAVAEHETTLARIRALTGGPHA